MSFVRGIATNQAQSNAGSPYSADRPWEYSYTQGDPGFHGKFYGLSHPGSYSANGPQGSGFYQTKSPDQQALGARQYYLNQFKQNMPTMADQMGHELGANINQQVGSQTQQAKTNLSSRGLLNSGIEAGAEGAINANAASNLAQGRASINQGLQGEYNKQAQQTVQAGFDLQQQQQNIQNTIYQQAMKSFAANQGLFGQAVGTGIIAGAVLA